MLVTFTLKAGGDALVPPPRGPNLTRVHEFDTVWALNNGSPPEGSVQVVRRDAVTGDWFLAGEGGRLELDKLASAMKELETEIPQDIAWVLRVDGHTDTDPIQTSAFSSNWELSAARAIAVVNELIAQGVSPKRLVAAGFGEYQPIEQGDTEEIKTRNRRIELKLTER